MLNIIRFLHKSHWTLQCRHLASKHPKPDPKQVEELKRELDGQRIFTNVDVSDFEEIYRNDPTKKEKIIRIIDMYDKMKYNLEDVPSTLTQADLIDLLEYDECSYIKRYLNRLHGKELNKLTKKELNKQAKEDKEKNDIFNPEADCGLFNLNGCLQYGLWRNSLVTRLPKINRTRFWMDRWRNAELYGQNLYFDFSFSDQLSLYSSSKVATEVGRAIVHNHYALSEPFRITLCGVDYDSHLWKAMLQYIHALHLNLETINHTQESFLTLCPKKSDIVYITNMETERFVDQYNPNAHYVMAALSEKELLSSNRNYLLTKLKTLKVRRQAIPIDNYILWQAGSKMLPLLTRTKILYDHRNNLGWKENLVKNLNPLQIKSENQVMQEDKQLSARFKKKPLSKKIIYKL